MIQHNNRASYGVTFHRTLCCYNGSLVRTDARHSLKTTVIDKALFGYVDG